MCKKLFDSGDSSALGALAAYYEARYKSTNFVAKRRLSRDVDQVAREAAYAFKNRTAIEALRAGVASVGIDATCDPGMLSVRINGRGTGHIPACELPDDVHDAIVRQLGTTRTNDTAA